MKNTAKRRVELADFLKTRRARLHPEQFNLPTFNQRRTPGLRREEIAQLAGLGVSWYTWLEQGRNIQVSDQVLERLAQVLQLNEEERSHLFVLARGSATMRRPQEQEALSQNTVYQAILNGLGIYPAQIYDRHLNVVAWNESSSRVFGNYAGRSERERNAAWFVFVNPSSRKFLVNWERAARQSIALLHAISDQYADDVWLKDLIADLRQASPEFRAWWPRHDILLSCTNKNSDGINHPLVGRLMLQTTTLVVPERSDMQMIVHTPMSQDDTEAKLRVLMHAGSQTVPAYSRL
jgi:transcriptional regulator with XRE-family HTH domain